MSARELSIGETLGGKYRILGVLGTGGMGTVYAAKRLALGDVVAIKCLLPSGDTPENRARFLREAQAAASIHHPNVVQVFDLGSAPVPYIVMELIEGHSLAETLHTRGKLPIIRALRLFGDLCAAIDAGHRRGIVHRDLKPGNVMLAQHDDGRETVKVLDFGIAKISDRAYGEARPPALTATGAVMGTFQYLAPEQLQGKGGNEASDVFALGTILYEMMTGEVPFDGPTPAAILFSIASCEYRPPRQLVPELPDTVVAAIVAALALDPKKRPASPDALARIAGAPRPSVPPPGTPKGPSNWESGPHLQISEQWIDETLPFHPSQIAPSAPANLRGSMLAIPVAGAREAPSLTHFVGRAHEQHNLRAELAAAREGRGRITVIMGEAGVGKTHLLTELLTIAREQGAIVMRGQFFDYEGSQPPAYATFLAMLSPGGILASARQVLNIAEPKKDDPDSSPLDAAGDKWRTFQQIADAFAAAAALSSSTMAPTPRARPVGPPTNMVVLAFDDWQWASALDLELVTHLHRALAHVPVFIVGTARGVPGASDSLESTGSMNVPAKATELDRWLAALGHRRAHAVLPLGPLSSDEVRQWFDVGFSGNDSLRIRPSDLRAIERATSGNPYYLYEVTRHLLATAQIRRESSAWVCAPLDDVVLPATLATAVRAQLDGVSDRSRAVLETAAVIGEELRFDTLQAATELGEEDLERILERAVRRRILLDEGVTVGNDYRFRSETVRRLLYDEMSPRRRKRLHQKVVDALHLRYEGNLRRIARALCYHHHAVGDYSQALTYGLLAADDDLRSHDVDRAEASLKRARRAETELRATGAVPDKDLVAQLDSLTGTIEGRLGRYESARIALERVIASDAPILRRFDALLEVAQVYLGTGALDESRNAANEAAALAFALGDKPREHLARIVGAQLNVRLGKVDEVVAELTTTLSELDAQTAPGLRSLALRALAWASIKTGAFREGEAYARDALDLALKARDPLAEHQAYSAIAAAFGEGGDAAAAIPYQEKALALSRALSTRRREAIDLANLGEAYFNSNQHAEALTRFSEALSIFIEIGDRACEGDCRVNVGRALLGGGQHQEAIKMLAAGRDLCDASGRREYGALARLYLGEALIVAGDPQSARLELEEARDVFAEDRLHYLWSAEYALARAHHDDPATVVKHAEAAANHLGTLIGHMPAGADSASKLRTLGEVESLLADAKARAT